MQLNPIGGFGILNKFDAIVDPTANNDNTQGYEVGSHWVNLTNGSSFILVDDTTGAAIWDSTNQNNVDGGSFGDQYINTGNVDGGSF